MHTLFDKLLIFICCNVWMILSTASLSFDSVLALLTAFSSVCFLSFLNPDGNPLPHFKQSPASYLILPAFVLLCLPLPALTFYLPLIWYDTLYTRFYLIYPAGVIIYFLSPRDVTRTIVFLLFLALSTLLWHHSRKVTDLSRQIKELRDTSTEYNRMLSKRNRDLLEKQDYEIYLATLKERNRIAREIHDNVGHMLSRSILQSGALIAINRQENLEEPLHALKDTLNSAMNSIRESVHDLHDDSIDLKTSVEQMLADYSQYRIRFDYDMSRTVARNVKYCFLAIIKEALSNLTKHSNATALTIVMREHPGLYQLFIEDNGTHIILRDSGIGLSNMRERVDSLGGTLTIHTEQGFRIFVSIPVHKLQEQ